MAVRKCPNCGAVMPAGSVAVYSYDLVCASCQHPLAISELSRNSAAFAGLAAGAIAWGIVTLRFAGQLGWNGTIQRVGGQARGGALSRGRFAAFDDRDAGVGYWQSDFRTGTFFVGRKRENHAGGNSLFVRDPRGGSARRGCAGSGSAQAHKEKIALQQGKFPPRSYNPVMES